MLCDWGKKTISFLENGKQVQLTGVSTPSVSLQELPVELFFRCCKGNDVWVVAMVSIFIEIVDEALAQAISQLLDEFQDIFGQPKELPPYRVHDHTIPLLPDPSWSTPGHTCTPLHTNMKLSVR